MQKESKPSENVSNTRAPARKRKRPVPFSEWIAGEILHRIAGGDSLRAVCQSPGMPTFQSVLRWVAERPDFATQYAAACDMRAQFIADEILEIADDTSNDTITIERGESETQIPNKEWIQRSCLRVDARKWILARLAPKRYGDKITQEISGPDGGPVRAEVAGPTAEDISKFATDCHRAFFKAIAEARIPIDPDGQYWNALVEAGARHAEGTLTQSAAEIGQMIASITISRAKIIRDQSNEISP